MALVLCALILCGCQKTGNAGGESQPEQEEAEEKEWTYPYNQNVLKVGNTCWWKNPQGGMTITDLITGEEQPVNETELVMDLEYCGGYVFYTRLLDNPEGGKIPEMKLYRVNEDGGDKLCVLEDKAMQVHAMDDVLYVTGDSESGTAAWIVGADGGLTEQPEDEALASLYRDEDDYWRYPEKRVEGNGRSVLDPAASTGMFGGIYQLRPEDEAGTRLYFWPSDGQESRELVQVYGENCLVTPSNIVYQFDERTIRMCGLNGTKDALLWQSEGPLDIRLVNCDEDAVYAVRDGALMRLSLDGTWEEILSAERFAACEGTDILDGYLYTVDRAGEPYMCRIALPDIN